MEALDHSEGRWAPPYSPSPSARASRRSTTPIRKPPPRRIRAILGTRPLAAELAAEERAPQEMLRVSEAPPAEAGYNEALDQRLTDLKNRSASSP